METILEQEIEKEIGIPEEVQTPENEKVRLALQGLEEIEWELRRRKKEKGLEYFVPNEVQLRACRTKARELAFVGGNRSSKSTTGAFIMCSHLTRQYGRCSCHGEWFSRENRFTRPIKAVVVVTEFPIIERVIEARIMEQLPKDWIEKIKRSPQGYLTRITGKDGGTIDVLTNEMADMAFESADWDFAWIDEPTQKSKYYAIQRGLLDRRGKAILTFTPLIEPWMKAEIVDKADGINRETIHASTYDNTRTIHGNPILSREAIRSFELDLPIDVRESRVYGKFFHLRGVVYVEFTPSVHETEFDYEYPDPVVCVLDPHERKPHWVIWASIKRNDDICVDSELIERCSLTDLKKKILLHEANKGYAVKKRLIDPNFGQSPSAPGASLTVRQLLASSPYPVPFGLPPDDKEAGRFAVKEALHFDINKPVTFTNKPKLYFHKSRAMNTIRSVKNYQYSEWVGKVKSDRDEKEDTKDLDSDGADCVRYLCVMKPKHDFSRAYNHDPLLREAY